MSRNMLELQRTAGNRAVAGLAEQQREACNGAEANGRPRVSISGFGSMGSPKATPDKSKGEGSGEQDQSLDTSSFGKEAQGLGITAEMSGVTTSEEHPDGFRWTQTIDTNVPLGGTTSPYVDPRPNDDTLPFYWTEAETASMPTTFEDHPSRQPPATDVTTWRATLALNGVNLANKTVTAYDCMTYGFNLDSAGTVTLAHPQSTSFGSHQSILASEFPAWTFN